MTSIWAIWSISILLFVGYAHGHLINKRAVLLHNPKAGNCTIYRGSVCRNASAFGNRTEVSVWTDFKHSHEQMDIVIQNIFKRVISDNPNESFKQDCLDLAKEVMCAITFPPCDTLFICRDGCQTVQTKCPKEWVTFFSIAIKETYSKGISPNHTFIPRTCNSTYIKDAHPCIPAFKSVDLGSDDYVVYIAVASGCVLLLLAVVAYCYRRKHRSHSSQRSSSVDMPSHLLPRGSNVNMSSLGSSGSVINGNPYTCKHGTISSGAHTCEPPTPNSIEYPTLGGVRKFKPDQIIYDKQLGEGNYGKVYAGILVDGDKKTPVALKILKAGANGNAKQQFFDEVSVNSMLDHKNIVKFMGVSVMQEPYCMILEYMEMGNLNNYLANCAAPQNKEHRILLGKAKHDYVNVKGVDLLSHDDLMQFIIQAAVAVEYLASMRILHRDIAARNCLLQNKRVLKLSDFGLCKDVYADQIYRVQGAKILPIRWVPAEVILRSVYTEESDVYSFGVLMWEIFSFAMRPFYQYTNEEVILLIQEGKTAKALKRPPSCINDIVWNLMVDCWKFDASGRPRASQVRARLQQLIEDGGNSS